MCGAKHYRETAQSLIRAANRSLDKRVQATLQGLARQALQIAAELEGAQQNPTDLVTGSKPERRKGKAPPPPFSLDRECRCVPAN